MPSGIERVSSGRGFSEFIELPFSLYEDDPLWVAPIRGMQRHVIDPSKGHPFHEHAETACFLARSPSGRAVGRICAIVNRAHNDFHHDKTGFFGFLEAVDDQGVFDSLLETASGWLRERGMDTIRGPMNFSTNEEIGTLVDGFDRRPVLMMTYNPPYHGGRIEAAGFSKAKDVLAYLLEKDRIRWDRMRRLAGLVERRTGAEIRTVRRRHLYEDVLTLMDIYNECWSSNWGFVPMTDAEFRQMAKDLSLMLVEDLAPVVYENGRAVAFAVGLQDANAAFHAARGSLLGTFLRLKVPPFRMKLDGVRVLLLAVREKWRGCGLESLIISRMIETGFRMGVTWSELSWVLEDNHALRAILEEEMNTVVYKTYRIYDKNL